jgi:hypothetical protein
MSTDTSTNTSTDTNPINPSTKLATGILATLTVGLAAIVVALSPLPSAYDQGDLDAAVAHCANLAENGMTDDFDYAGCVEEMLAR